jgi:hypothetical protein
LQNLQKSFPQLKLSKRGAKASKKVLRRKGKPGREAPLRALFVPKITGISDLCATKKKDSCGMVAERN